MVGTRPEILILANSGLRVSHTSYNVCALGRRRPSISLLHRLQATFGGLGEGDGGTPKSVLPMPRRDVEIQNDGERRRVPHGSGAHDRPYVILLRTFHITSVFFKSICHQSLHRPYFTRLLYRLNVICRFQRQQLFAFFTDCFPKFYYTIVHGLFCLYSSTGTRFWRAMWGLNGPTLYRRLDTMMRCPSEPRDANHHGGASDNGEGLFKTNTTDKFNVMCIIST